MGSSGMTAYYNEIDPAAVAMLEQLIADGVIAPGVVDNRSIKDVQPNDLSGFTQCHFFAGGGLWSVAARMAGWPDHRPIWTGSCPCQPFSAAGKGLGKDDPRHLWPDFHRLIRTSRPAVVMGEQVAGARGYDWFDGVRSDLAKEGYASRGVDIPACSVDAPHQRNRLYWIATAPGVLPDTEHTVGWAHDDIRGGRHSTEEERQGQGAAQPGELHQASHGGHNGSWWADAEWIDCHDGKGRRTKSGLPLLVDGVSGRVDLWRVGGNAIVPILAAEVIGAFMEVSP
jgi:DNA (cytosine-5)-methyltransferase 1